MKKLWFLLFIPLAVFAATNARPIYRGLMQSDLNAGGFSITNAETVKAVRFVGSGSNLTDITSGGDTFWVTNSDTGGISNNFGSGFGPGGSASFLSGGITITSGGGITLAGAYIANDGSASFGNNTASIDAGGNIGATSFASGSSFLNADGSASFAGGATTIGLDGGITNATGASFANGACTISTAGLISGNGSGITNLPTSTVTATNFVSGKFYTNSTGRTLLIHLSAGLTVAAVSGDSTLDLMVDEAGGHVGTILDRVGLSTLVTSIAMTYTNSLNGPIVSGGVYWITNNSTGSGNSAAPVAGTGRLTRL